MCSGLLALTISSDFDEISKKYPVPLEAKQDYKGGASAKSIVSGPKKKKADAKSAVKTSEEARKREESSGTPAYRAYRHHPVLHQGNLDDRYKSCVENSASKRHDAPSGQRMSQSQSHDNPQVAYPPVEYSQPTYHYAYSQHGRYHEHPASSAQWHGYHHNHHYPGYYYPPAPVLPQPQDVSRLHSDSTFEDGKAWANFPSPPRSSPSSSNIYKPRTMDEQNTNDGLGRDTGDPFAPISLAEQSSHGDSSDQGAPLRDDTLEQASRLFLSKTSSAMHDEESIGRDSVSAAGVGTQQESSFDVRGR